MRCRALVAAPQVFSASSGKITRSQPWLARSRSSRRSCRAWRPCRAATASKLTQPTVIVVGPSCGSSGRIRRVSHSLRLREVERGGGEELGAGGGDVHEVAEQHLVDEHLDVDDVVGASTSSSASSSWPRPTPSTAVTRAARRSPTTAPGRHAATASPRAAAARCARPPPAARWRRHRRGSVRGRPPSRRRAHRRARSRGHRCAARDRRDPAGRCRRHTPTPRTRGW